MPIATYVFVFAAAYLLGSIPFGYLLVRFVRREDIRSIGSGNIGATNVLRSGSRGLGLLTFLLDAAKGYLAVALAAWLISHAGFAPIPVLDARALAGLAAILGHVFPVWLRFRGGKGVATALGVFLALLLWAALAGLGVFLVVALVWRYVSLASIAAAISFPVFGLLLPGPARTPLFTAVLFLVPLLVIVKHHQNIGRLLRGTEYRFGNKPKATAA